jgi:TP901 family phage tail tape measure protein
MAIRDETLRLQFEVEGISNLRDLRTQIDALGEQGKQSATELSALTDSLANTGALQQSLARLRELGQQYIGLQQRLRETQAATVALDAASKASAANQAQLRAAVAQQEQGLLRLAEAAKRGEISEEQRQRASVEARTEISKLTAELRTAEVAQRKYDAELDKSRDTISRLATQQAKLREPIQQIRAELEKAGVASKSYSAAQSDLQARAAQSRSALDALANTISQQVAANRAAAVSVEQLAEANATLGRRGFGDIAAEIAKVRAAYETLRNSGTVSTRELAQAQSRLIERTRELRSEYGSLGNSLRQVQGSLIAAGASLFTVTRVLGNASRASAEFSKSIAAIGTIAPQADLDALSESVRNLTREFGGDSAKQAAALYEIIAAGVEDTSSALEILATANKLAIGGLADTGIAASGLVATLNAYGLSAENATRVSDAFFVAAAAGNTTIEQLSQNIGGVAPLAAAVGVSFEQLTAAVGALTAGGLDTGQAFTQVQSLLTALVKPTKEAADEAERLGIQFDTAALKSQGLQGFLSSVSTAAGGSETSLAKLFGRVEGLQGVLALTGNQADAFAKALTDMETGAGRTEAAFARLADTPAQAAARFQAAVGELQKSFGDAVNSATPLLESLTGLVNLFNELPKGLRTGVAGVVALTAVVAPLAIAIVQSRAALVLLLGSLRAIGPAAAAAGAGMGVFSTASTGATAAAGRLSGSLAILSRAFAVLGAAAVGLEIGTALSEPLTRYRLSVDEAAQSTVRLAFDVDSVGQAGAEAANRFANFGVVAVKTAGEVQRLGEQQREAYRASLEGLNAFLRGRAEELIAQQRSAQLTAEQSKELSGLFTRLDEVRAGFVNLDSAALGAAESIRAVGVAGATSGVQDVAVALTEATSSAEAFGEALGGLFDGLDITAESQKVGDIALALAAVGSTSAEAAATVRDTLAAELAKLSGVDLLEFQRAAEAAFGSLEGAAFDASNVLDTTLQEQLRRLGVNMQAAGVQITDTGRQIIASFQAIAESGRASAGAVQAAFTAALGKATTSAEVEALGETLKRAFDAGKISAQQYGAAVSAAAERTREIVAGANDATGAIGQIGEAGKAAAQSLINAFRATRANLAAEANRIAASIGEALASGGATDALKAQLAGVEAQIQATNAQISGLESGLNDVGKSGIDAGKNASNGLGTIIQSAKGATDAAKDAGAAVEDIGDKSTEAGEKVKSGVSSALLGLISITQDARATAEDFGVAATEAFERLRGELGIVNRTGKSTAAVMQEIADRAQGAADFAEELKLQIGDTEARAKRTADAVAQIRDRAREAASELDSINRELQDEADRREGNDEAIRRREYETLLRRIDESAKKGDAASAASAAKARALAKANFDADIAEIRAREREQLDSDRRVDDDRRQRSGGGTGATGSGALPGREAAQPAGGFGGTINITGVTDPQEVARQVIREIERLDRRGFNPRNGL